MSIYSVVAEYNPFHNGHKYHIDKIRKNCDCDGVVAVMSGNFVQRGDAAIMSKYKRANAALKNGVDLVIELPVPYAVSSAERFSYSAVSILNSLGIVDKLSFGSECGEVDKLSAAAQAVMSSRVDAEITEQLKSGMSYPAARMNLVEKHFGKETALILEKPNNILGVEYIKAIKKLNSNIIPTTVLRCGAEHDSKTDTDNFASASLLRQKLLKNESIKSFVPENAFPIYQNEIENEFAPANINFLETAILASLRLKSAEDFASLPDVSEGIENRILSALKTSSALTELFDKAKTKRYTHSRIRRIVFYSFLGITRELQNTQPPYIRVLGFNENGKRLLRMAKENSSLPIVGSTSDIKKLNAAAQSMFEFECKATDVFNLALPKIRQCGTDMTDNLVIIE